MSNMAEMLDKHNINACAILVGVDPAQNKRNCHRESGFKLTGANVFFIIHLERMKVQEQPTLFGSFYLFQTWTWEAFLHLTELSNIKNTFLKTIKLSSEVEKWERLLHKGWEGGQRERKEKRWRMAQDSPADKTHKRFQWLFHHFRLIYSSFSLCLSFFVYLSIYHSQ